MHHTFLYISLLSLHNYDVKMPIISRFVEDVNTRQLLSFSFPQLGYNLLEFNSWIPLFHACGRHTPSFWVTRMTCFESIDTICQIWPIRGYTRNWCTGTSCLKKWLQAPPPLLSPRFLNSTELTTSEPGTGYLMKCFVPPFDSYLSLFLSYKSVLICSYRIVVAN